MIENFTEGQAKDEILKYALSVKSDDFTIDNLKKDLFPKWTKDEILFLINEINDYKEELIKVRIGKNRIYLLKVGLSKGFLDRGGFTKLEKDSKKEPIPRYQKIYLTFFIFFGILGLYQTFFPSVSKSDFQTLENDFHKTKNRLDSLIQENKKNITPRIELLNDTSQTKNYHDLNIGTDLKTLSN